MSSQENKSLHAIEGNTATPEKRLKVLIVDDEPDFFDSLRMTLKDSLDLEYASDGFTAFKMAAIKRYDCIVTDINMPFMDGLTLLDEFQKKYLNTPIVVISGDMNHDIMKEVLRAGAYNVLEKPFPANELEHKIRTAVEIHSQQDISTTPDHEKAHIYNTLKAHYYDIEKIMSKINKYQIPLSFIKNELDKKAHSGKCLLDDLSNLKYYHKNAS